MNIDVELNKILANFVTGDLQDMPIEEIKQAFEQCGYTQTVDKS
jgi:hypothetical protein